MAYGREPGTQAIRMKDIRNEAVGQVFRVRYVDISEEEWPALQQPVMGDRGTVFQRWFVFVEEAEDLPDQLSG